MKKVLIIDDDQATAKLYLNKLVTDGYEVKSAPDAEKGFEVARTFQPDLMLLDLVLPKMSGVELIRKIRAQPEFVATPLIVFSSSYLTQVLQDARQAGANKCLSKSSCTPKQISEIIRATLDPKLGHAALTAATTFTGTTTVPEPTQSDEQFQAELQRNLVKDLPAIMATLRTLLQGLFKSETETLRLGKLHELYRRVHALTGNAGLANLPRLALLSDALEVLLKDLHEKPASLNSSTLRTVASAVDCLDWLSKRTGTLPAAPAAANILVVDDEAISRRAVAFALDKARLKSTQLEDPLAALELLSSQTFDLIFLDVDMPKMNGFELCSKLRAAPANKKTPVVFVTALNSFDSRANSTMSGGNDFIAKPFSFIELAVKALIYLLRAQPEPVLV